jgi:hypothetical protein
MSEEPSGRAAPGSALRPAEGPTGGAAFMRVQISGFGREPTTLEAPIWFPPFPRAGRVVFAFEPPEPKLFPREGFVSVEMLGEHLLDSLCYTSETLARSLRPEGKWLPEPWVQLNASQGDALGVQPL